MSIGLTIIFRNILWEKKILGPVFLEHLLIDHFNTIFMENIKKKL